MKDLLKKLLLNASVVAVCAVGAGAANAQMAPGSLPEAATQQPPASVFNNQNNSGSTATGGARSSLGINDRPLTDNPCPEPKKALASTPDDLARIQEDITRFTLCVQRAQLLERLNELATANIETIDSALNLTASNQMDGNAVPGIMPNVPMPQLPESISNMLQDDSDDFGGSSAQSDHRGSSGASSSASASRPAPAPSEWRIREIEGTGGSTIARLVNRDGVLLKVSAGERLPDDGGRVSSVTRTGVTITIDGQKQTLKWVE